MSAFASGGTLRAAWLGRARYLEAWRLQEAVASRVRAGAAAHLLLLEHDPVYTIGRSGSESNLLATPSELRAAGASVFRVDRGGDITYHGPGQLVGYPIVRLAEAPDLVRYVRGLEAALIAVCAGYGIRGQRVARKTGVWVEMAPGRMAKIAAIGVRVSRRVTTHGFALNVSTDLAAFARMLPCGFAHEVTSFEALGVRAEASEVAVRAGDAVAEALGLSLAWGDVAPARDDEIPAEAPVRSAHELPTEAAA